MGLKPHLQSHFENLISKYKRLNQNLNCRGGDASPIEIERTPIEIWAYPHGDLSAGWSEVKDQQNPVKYSIKFRGNSD